jgi:CheY-like chemotaxis protein
VLAADGGAAAVELAATWTAKIDRVVTDLAMPGLGGRETAQRLRGLFPGAR